MNHHDHVRLIESGVGRNSGGVWADLGAGSGAFTLALRDIAGPEVEIYAVDRDRGSLRALQAAMERDFPGTRLHVTADDFTQPLKLPPLDGIVAANAMHFVHEQTALLRDWRGYLKPKGNLVVVEYASDRGNRWVPYPLSLATFGEVAQAAGFTEPVLTGQRPSHWLNGFYAALTRPREG